MHEPNMDLEVQFTTMLKRTDTYLLYRNMLRLYLFTDSEYNSVKLEDAKLKLKELRASSPSEWIPKVFTEGMDMPEELSNVQRIWIQRLTEVGY